MYQFLFSSHFKRKYKKFIRANPVLEKKTARFFGAFEKFPFENKFKTHKVITKEGDTAWSSSITSDLRIIWDFSKEEYGFIDLLDIGGHSGKNKVYK